MRRLAILCLALAGCNGAGDATPVTNTAAAQVCFEGLCAPTHDELALLLAARDDFYATAYFNVGDEVVNCPTGEVFKVAALRYPTDGTVQLDSGRWVQMADLIQNGPPYSCDGQRRPLASAADDDAWAARPEQPPVTSYVIIWCGPPGAGTLILDEQGNVIYCDPDDATAYMYTRHYTS